MKTKFKQKLEEMNFSTSYFSRHTPFCHATINEWAYRGGKPGINSDTNKCAELLGMSVDDFMQLFI